MGRGDSMKGLAVAYQSEGDKLCGLALEYTDSGTWKHSWHWPHDRYGHWGIEAVKAAMNDLRCGDMQQEILAAVRRIKDRYALADRMKEYIKIQEEGGWNT